MLALSFPAGFVDPDQEVLAMIAVTPSWGLEEPEPLAAVNELRSVLAGGCVVGAGSPR
jgi:hypothetical protein